MFTLSKAKNPRKQVLTLIIAEIFTEDRHIQGGYDRLRDEYEKLSTKTSEFVTTINKVHKRLIEMYNKNTMIKKGHFNAATQCTKTALKSITDSIECLLFEQNKFYNVIKQKQTIHAYQQSQDKLKKKKTKTKTKTKTKSKPTISNVTRSKLKKRKKKKSISNNNQNQETMQQSQDVQDSEETEDEDDDIEIINDNHNRIRAPTKPIEQRRRHKSLYNYNKIPLKRKRKRNKEEEDESKLEIVDNDNNNTTESQQQTKKRKTIIDMDTNQSNINIENDGVTNSKKKSGKKIGSMRSGLGHPSTWNKKRNKKIYFTQSDSGDSPLIYSTINNNCDDELDYDDDQYDDEYDDEYESDENINGRVDVDELLKTLENGKERIERMNQNMDKALNKRKTLNDI